MNFTFNGKYPENINYNGTPLNKLQYNGVTVWEKSEPEVDYMYIVPEKDGTFYIIWPQGVDNVPITSLSYSYDRREWTSVTLPYVLNTRTEIPVYAGEPLYLKGIADKYGTVVNTEHCVRFNCSLLFGVYGNMMALLYGDDYAAHPEFSSNNTYAFCNMFSGLGSTYCKIKEFCAYMPTIAIGYCYNRMFLKSNKLTKIVSYVQSVSGGNQFQYWLNGSSSTGTFYNLGGYKFNTGTSGIPSGWTVKTQLD